MLNTDECLKILNKNKNKKYTREEAQKLKTLLYQFGEIAYLQFKQTEANEKSYSICKSIN